MRACCGSGPLTAEVELNKSALAIDTLATVLQVDMGVEPRLSDAELRIGNCSVRSWSTRRMLALCHGEVEAGRKDRYRPSQPSSQEPLYQAKHSEEPANS